MAEAGEVSWSNLPAELEKELTAARSILTKAADQGNTAAQRDLADMYDFGHGVSRDLEYAVHLNTLASEAGDPHAMYNLGICYRDGEGVEQDVEKARQVGYGFVTDGYGRLRTVYERTSGRTSRPTVATANSQSP